MSSKPLGARSIGRARSVLVCLSLAIAPVSLGGDIGGPEPPTFEQRFSESKIVGTVRIVAGVIGAYSSQIYRARVVDNFKGAKMDQTVYFWGGNVDGSTAYGIGQVYLVLLRDAGKPVSDVAEAFASPTERLYESIYPDSPILNWRPSPFGPPPPANLPTDQSVFLFAGAAPALAHGVLPGSILFHRWMGHDEMFEYLRKLATAEVAKARAGA